MPISGKSSRIARTRYIVPACEKKSNGWERDVPIEEGYDLDATHSQSRVQWSALVKWQEGKRCFLPYPSPRMASIIPKRFFQSPTDIDSIRLILQAKVLRKSKKPHPANPL
jgi:hypothetical protein